MNWFLHKLRDADDETQAAARLLVTFALGTFFSVFAFIPVFYNVVGLHAAVFVGIVLPFIGSAVFILRWTGALHIAAQYYVVTSWLLLTGLLVILGGLVSPATPAFNLLVLASTFMLGRRIGIAWTVICIVTFIVIYVLFSQGILVSEYGEHPLHLLGFLANSAITLLNCLFALRYDEAKAGALYKLRNANRRMARMISSLEQASARLISSSEHLLGSEQDKSHGLVGEMMQRARAGRHTMEEARESVAGMIHQYRQISERVQALSRHSQNIVELVSTIDRISDRLDLMALNIGIEAVRNGDSGKQFNTIAQDMRMLAERVFNETGRIKNSLKNVNIQVQQVLQSSEFGQGLTEESIERMSVMVGTFDEIYSLIEQAEGATGQITADTLLQIEAVRKLVTVTEKGDTKERATSGRA